jgi:hypothetical protein
MSNYYKKPFEIRIDDDMQKLQKALLNQRYFGGKKRVHVGDALVFWVSIIGLIAIGLGWIA